MNARRTPGTQALGILIFSGLLVIGSLAPWELGATGSRLGVEEAGLFTLLLALMAALLAIPKRPWPTVVLIVGVVSLAITVGSVIDIAASMREPSGLEPPAVEIDWGLWISLLASVGIVWSAWSLRCEIEGRPSSRLTVPSWTNGWIRRNPEVFGLLVLLAIGLLVRIALTVAWRPAFTGYSDSGIYFQGAFESVWSDPIRMAGYSMFLDALHAISPHLASAIAVQHAMGLGAAAIIFFTVRRCGGPAWLGLVPAAALALGGDQIFIEHAALSEALFIFFVVATLYAAVRASDDRIWWSALAGLAAGFAVWGRTAGIGLAIVVSVWLVFSAGRPERRTLIAGALSFAVAMATIGIYAGWRSIATDQPGTLTSNNAWNLYGRVASWADCEKFDPPPGTEELCEKTPLRERGLRSGEEYIFSDSPATRLIGPPYRLPEDPTAMDRLQSWSEAAVKGQPLDYLRSIWLDARRLFSPNAPSYGQLSADGLVAFTAYGADRSGRNEYVEYWQGLLYPDDPPPRQGSIEAFLTWQAMTRIVGFWMAAAIVLSLVGLVVLRGRPRSGASLFVATAFLLLVFPILSKSYDYRFVIPAFSPLAAAAALGAWGLVDSIGRKGRDSDRTGRRSVWIESR